MIAGRCGRVAHPVDSAQRQIRPNAISANLLRHDVNTSQLNARAPAPCMA